MIRIYIILIIPYFISRENSRVCKEGKTLISFPCTVLIAFHVKFYTFWKAQDRESEILYIGFVLVFCLVT